MNEPAHLRAGQDRPPRLPIRAKLAIPHHDRQLWWGLDTRLTVWLREFGPLRCVRHSGGWCVNGQAMALYFRTPEDAQACIAAFPEFELADGVLSDRGS